MALGQFGSLIQQGKSSKYNYSISGDYGMNTLLTTLGKTKFVTPAIAPERPAEATLENLSEDGVEVIS